MTHQTIHGLFEAQARLTPHADAVRMEGQSLTYAQMNARANQLAHSLRGRGIERDKCVGLCLERSLEMAVAVLAVLKAGGAYVPLDPAYPSERLQLMLDTAHARVVLTQTSLLSVLPSHQNTLCLDNDWPGGEYDTTPANLTDKDDLCYVIFTSGSTGTPKGVALSHGALHNLITWQAAHSPLGAGDRTLQFASLSFDVSFQEMFATWASGGTLVLIPDTLRRDPRGLLRLIEQEGIARLFLPFVALQQLASSVREGESVPASLREIMTAGEQLQITPQLMSFFQKSNNCVLHNQYGPSETHVVTQYTLTGAPETWPALPPIGLPIANTTAHILDDAHQPVPPGIEGELYVGGDGLARGYLNQPQLTAERFLTIDGTRLYKTGDRARFFADGNIEFLGRADGQVKVRGFRIEVGEVEHALAQYPAVRQCVVIAAGDKADKQLAAYVVMDGELNVQKLRLFLSQTLPAYMVPARFVQTDALPLTPSGKVDRRALLTLHNTAPAEVAPAADDDAPTDDDIARKLTALWQNVLSVKHVGPRDNFFDLGGHSLLAVRLFVQIEKQFGTRLPLPALFAAPTVAQMANLLRGKDTTQSISRILVPIQTQGTQPPLFCIHHIDGIVVCYGDLSRHLGTDQPLYGLQAPALIGEDAPPARVEDIAARYAQEIIQAYPCGPYRLCGLSFGGTVAFEIACQMRAQGRIVEFVGLLDTYGPAYFRSEHATEGERPVLLRAAQQWDTFRRMEGGGRGALVKTKAHSALKRLRDVLPATRATDWEVADYLPSVLQAVRAANEAAQKDYFPDIYPGKITLLRAHERLDRTYNDPLLSWGGLAAGGLAVHDILGNHYTIIKEPFVRALADTLRDTLNHSSE